MELTQYQQQITGADQRSGSGTAVPISVCRLNAAAGAVASTVAGGQNGPLDQHHRLLRDRLGDLLESTAGSARDK
ncbi:hypothetical protein [Actinoplanes couchii]|uniref:Uncharacterized protein n=1 Tax=Actinoplanes couchii TaxID=403638 RepID=A0ABQ3XS23_9ACTN|nr:hypothetical protein [Actinoplanes couchii]MDR6318777.1 hypothetical protein [Actinoplanes couchii]GID61306.1 hypothetical protein Aco03nite_097100 [Actinoplanes couchii]